MKVKKAKAPRFIAGRSSTGKGTRGPPTTVCTSVCVLNLVQAILSGAIADEVGIKVGAYACVIQDGGLGPDKNREL